MHWPDFHEIGLAGNLAAFGLASAVVWLAGDRLARCSQVIADRTRLGQAFIGTVLLGVTVSLPEMTLAAVAAGLGNAELAVNSLLGGIGITMVVLAITDLAVGEEPLSVDVQHPVVLLQGALVIVMLTVAAGGITAGDLPLPGLEVAGAWTTVFRRARTYDARARLKSSSVQGGLSGSEAAPASISSSVILCTRSHSVRCVAHPAPSFAWYSLRSSALALRGLIRRQRSPHQGMLEVIALSPRTRKRQSLTGAATLDAATPHLHAR